MNLPQRSSKFVFFAIFGIVVLAATCPRVQASTLVSSPSSLAFGQVSVGTQRTINATLTNQSSSSLTLQRIHSTASTFVVSSASLPLTLAPGKSTSIAVTFSPSSTTYDTGTIFFNWGNAGTLAMNGTGVTSSWYRNVSVTPNPSALSFGSVQTGGTVKLPLSLKNTGTVQATISNITTSASAFVVQNVSLPLTLSVGQSYTFNVAFDPSASGAFSGTLQAVSSHGRNLASVALSGTGGSKGQLSLSPTSVSFGNVNVGSTSSKSGTLTASGSSVTVSSAGSNSSEFVLSGITLPVTIPAGGSASYSVTFKPQSSGTASGSVSFASNASNSTVSESLTGTGVSTTPPPQQHSVNLTWKASTSQVAGYNVYRGKQTGGPYTKVNSSVDTATNYTDSTVSSSTTYFYVTTSVNSSGQESTYSNQVQVAIP